MPPVTPRILCVAHQLPLPPDNGTAVRQLGLLGLLRQLGEVRLVTRPRTSATDEHVEELRATGLDLRLAPLMTPPAWHGVGLWARSIVRRTPPWYLLWCDVRLKTEIRDQLDWCTHLFALEEFSADYLLDLEVPPGRHVAIYKDLVYANPTFSAERGGSALRRAVRGWVTGHHERRMLDRADTVIVNTELEAEACARHLGRRPDVVLPNGVDVGRPWSPGPAQAHRVLWMGTLDNDWNRRGLLRFVAALRKADLRIELAVAGRGADDEVVTALAGLGKVLGYVADLDDLVVGYAATVIPVWGGGGGRVKSLVLLGSGIPVVATPASLEGIGAVDGVHCRIADTPVGLVAQLAEVLADPAGSAAMGRRARRLVAEEHSWESRLPLLRRALRL